VDCFSVAADDFLDARTGGALVGSGDGIFRGGGGEIAEGGEGGQFALADWRI